MGASQGAKRSRELGHRVPRCHGRVGGPVESQVQPGNSCSPSSTAEFVFALLRGLEARGIRQGWRAGFAQDRRRRHAPDLLAKASVGGKLAPVGSRLIDGVARKMADDFSPRSTRSSRPAVKPEPPPCGREKAAPPAWWVPGACSSFPRLPCAAAGALIEPSSVTFTRAPHASRRVFLIDPTHSMSPESGAQERI